VVHKAANIVTSMICSHQYPPWVMNGPKATSALSPFDSQLRTLVGADHRHRRLLRARRKRPCDDRAAEKRDEVATFHSITSSAVTSSLSGTVRPSAFAVLRLMPNSNFTVCWTGKSPGFSPFRIRPA
jgi:hypothetical protein